jgi:hypothetical protein
MEITIEFEKEHINATGDDLCYTKYTEVYTLAVVAAARVAALKATPWVEVLRVEEKQTPLIVCE